MTGTGDPVRLEIVVPAYNEALRLPRGLALLEAKLRELPVPTAIIVVDNASTDATADIVREWTGSVPIRLLHCAERGKGAAVRTGLLATRAPYVGFCDADMATDLKALDEVVGLLTTGHSVVVGSRRHPDSTVEEYAHPLRRLGAVVFNRLVRGISGGIADTQCGFKFFDGPLARAAATELRTTGFAFDAELLMHCARHGALITDLPVVWRDMPGTTFSMRRHTLHCLGDLARIRASARQPGPGFPATSGFSAAPEFPATSGFSAPLPLALPETSGTGPG